MRARSFIQVALLVGLIIVTLAGGSSRANPSGRQITINGMRLPLDQIQDVDRRLGYPLSNGRYWHDVRTGSWGRMGGPPLGSMPDGYFQQAHMAAHAPSNRVVAQASVTHSIGAMVDLNTDSNGPDDMSHTGH
jgi:hypothetical protein